MDKKKKLSALEISDQLAIDYPKVDEDKIINNLIKENEQLKELIREVITIYIHEIDFEYIKRATELLRGDEYDDSK